MASAAPEMSKERNGKGEAHLFRTLRRLPWRAAQGCHRQEPGTAWSKKDKDGNPIEGGTLKLSQQRLEKIIPTAPTAAWRTSRRHPQQGEITDGEVHPEQADTPPEYSFKETTESWKLMVPVDQRPKKQMNNFNLKNMFSVTLRDTGEVALIDGDTKEIRSIVKTGYAVHLAPVASGRYVAYVIGRDGRLSLIDLWMESPPWSPR